MKIDEVFITSCKNQNQWVFKENENHPTVVGTSTTTQNEENHNSYGNYKARVTKGGSTCGVWNVHLDFPPCGKKKIINF